MSIFLQFAIVLSLSSFFGYLVHKLKLPLVAAYLIAGVFLSLVAHFDPHSLGIFTFLPDLGIAFVLFLIGMELDLRELKSLGWPIILASLGQILISTLAGYAIAGAMGFDPSTSLYIGLGLSFSSTIVIIKLLLEKKELTSLYGKLSLGVALIEDLVAIIVLMLTSLGNSGFSLSLEASLPLLGFVIKAIILFSLTFFLSRYVLERIFDAVAKSVELLFLTAITWCFVFTALAVAMDFSVVIGSFLAGVALASSPYHLQIESKIKPLRDFFVTMFFVFLGAQIKLFDLSHVWPLILILTFYALVIKPLIFLLILGLFGFRKHTIFQTALNMSQISEFSLVIMLVGVNYNVVPPITLSIMASVAVLSIVLSSILISYSRVIYQIFLPILPFFEHTKKVYSIEAKLENLLEDHVIILGAHRIGGPVVDYLTKNKIPLIVMDFNPHIVEQLRKKGVNIVYGDIGDQEILDNLGLERAKLIISTIGDVTDNELLLNECRQKKVRAKIIVRALDDSHIKPLKSGGADYIILPEQVSADYLVSELKSHWSSQKFSGLD